VKTILSLTVNGSRHDVAVAANQTLLDVLRNELGLIGTKRGCGTGACGVCTVIIDGKAVLACLTLALECEGKAITTIEGMANPDGSLHPLQTSFIENGAVQCGFCTPGVLMTAKALLDRTPNPTDTEIRDALAGTICRCTGHIKIIEAIKKRPCQDGRGESDASET
jgi:aerobic carbon-monoxide dehydrogenase small subunit